MGDVAQEVSSIVGGMQIVIMLIYMYTAKHLLFWYEFNLQMVV